METDASKSYCLEHAPPGMRDKMRFGPHRTAAEEAAFLRDRLKEIDRMVADPVQREQLKADLEKRIADIEAGRRRFGDPG